MVWENEREKDELITHTHTLWEREREREREKERLVLPSLRWVQFICFLSISHSVLTQPPLWADLTFYSNNAGLPLHTYQWNCSQPTMKPAPHRSTNLCTLNRPVHFWIIVLVSNKCFNLIHTRLGCSQYISFLVSPEYFMSM